MSQEPPKSIRGVSESFKQRADSAAFYEAWVGAVLARAGLYTVHHPFQIDENKDFGHTWDLDVSLCHPDTLHYERVDVRCTKSSLTRVEVKSLSLTFMNPDTYPFDGVLICSQNSWLRKWPGKDTVQRDFLLVSRPTGSIVWIPKGTVVTLGTEVTDKSRSETYKVVTTHKSFLRPLFEFVEEVSNG